MSWLPMMTTSGARAESPIKVTRACVSASSAPASASISMKPSACEKLVTAPEPLADGNATAPCFAGDERHQHELLAAHLRRDPHRHARLDGLRGLRRQAGAGADHRRDEGVEGEDRRGRKSRQHRDRLAVGDREAERLAGLERHAMHQDAGLAELRHDAMREIARALRGAARQHHHVAFGERAAHRLLELRRRRRGTRRRAPARRRPRRWRRPGSRRWNHRRRRAASVSPSATSSSPVESTATFGRRTTSIAASPQAASMPISREPITWPLRIRVSPRAMSEPA